MNPVTLSDFLAKLSLFKGYNLINTFIFSLLGVIFYFLIVYPYILFRKIKINFYFILSVLSFVIVGAILRMFSQTNINFPYLIEFSTNIFSLGFYLVYPNLFLFLSVFFLIVYEFSVFISSFLNKDKYKILLIISLIILFPFLLLFFINIVNVIYFLIIILGSFLIFGVFYLFFKKIKINILKDKVSQITFISQILDSSTTFFSVVFLKDFFIEKHVFSHLIISINPFLFLIIKILFSLLLIYLIDGYIIEKDLNNYFKLFIIIIGFSTGLRNLFLISLSFM